MGKLTSRSVSRAGDEVWRREGQGDLHTRRQVGGDRNWWLARLLVHVCACMKVVKLHMRTHTRTHGSSECRKCVRQEGDSTRDTVQEVTHAGDSPRRVQEEISTF